MGVCGGLCVEFQLPDPARPGWCNLIVDRTFYLRKTIPKDSFRSPKWHDGDGGAHHEHHNRDAAATRPSPARKRLLDAATDLFYGEGIHSVGVDRIIEAAGVTRATMYKQFDGKEGLVLAYLQGEDEQLRSLFAAGGRRLG